MNEAKVPPTGPAPQRADAFSRLLDANLDSAFALASVILGRRDEAEEATYDGALRAWRRWRRIRDPGQFDGWFGKILLSVCLDRLHRRQWVDPSVPGSATQLLRDPFAPSEAADALRRAIPALSPDNRTLIAVRYLADLTLEQMANRLDWPAGTVRQRLDASLRELRVPFDATRAIDAAADERSFEDELRAAVRSLAPAKAPDDLHLRIAALGPESATARFRAMLRRPGAVRLSVTGLAVFVVLAATAAAMHPWVSTPGTRPADLRASEVATSSGVDGASGLAPALAGWSQTILDRSAQGIRLVGWSPDGSKFAVVGGRDLRTDAVEVRDRTGRLLRVFPGRVAAWVDDDHLLATTDTQPPDGTGSLWLRSATERGADEQIVGGDVEIHALLAGRSGGAALAGGTTFRMWWNNASNGTLSSPIPGWPLSWSADGGRVAYVTDISTLGRRSAGSLHVRDVPGGTSVDLHLRTYMTSTAVLDATNSHILTCRIRASNGTCEPVIIGLVPVADIAGKPLPGDLRDGMWLPDGSAVVELRDGSQLYRWTPQDGWRPLTLQEASGNVGRVGRIGAAVGVFVLDSTPYIRIVSDPGAHPSVLEFSVAPSAQWPLTDMIAAPDGARVAITRGNDQGASLLVLLERTG